MSAPKSSKKRKPKLSRSDKNIVKEFERLVEEWIEPNPPFGTEVFEMTCRRIDQIKREAARKGAEFILLALRNKLRQ